MTPGIASLNPGLMSSQPFRAAGLHAGGVKERWSDSRSLPQEKPYSDGSSSKEATRCRSLHSP